MDRPTSETLSRNVLQTSPRGFPKGVLRRIRAFCGRAGTGLLTGLALFFLGASTAQAELVLLAGCRILDTRQPGQGPALTGQTTRDVMIRGECGIPEEATGLQYRTTIVNPGAPGFVTLFPSDEARPVVSSLNFQAGEVVGAGGVVKLGAAEPSLSVFLATSPPGAMGDLVLDVTGYHVASRSMSVAARAASQARTYDRWTDLADGSAVDRLTGLQWELKGTSPGIHNVLTNYSWSATECGGPDGTAFTVLLAEMNSPPCFAGHCDWRLPTIDELASLREPPASIYCKDAPCTSIPGETADTWYSSSTTCSVGCSDTCNIMQVDFQVGETALTDGTGATAIEPISKLSVHPVRAVRDPG